MDGLNIKRIPKIKLVHSKQTKRKVKYYPESQYKE
jgi:hypothetical protein